MGKPIEIKLDAETKGAERGLANTADAIADVSDALDAVERPAKDAAGAVEDVGTAAAAAGREGADLDRDLTKALENVKRESKSTREAVETDARGMKDAFEGNEITAQDIFKENLKAELVSNMAEAGAEVVRGFKDGFDGEDMETVVDGITDTMVSVGTLGGPVGVAAGLAGGAVVQMFAGPLIAGAEEKAAQFAETFSTAFANIVENGAELGRELSIAASTDKFAQDTDKMADATKLATAIEIERGIVLRAMAGDQDALNIVKSKHTDLVNEGVAALDREAQEIAENGIATDETTAAADRAREAASGLQGALDATTTSYSTNTDALNASREAASAKAEADNYAAEKALASAAAMAASSGAAQNLEVTIDGVTRAFQVMPDGKTVEVTDDGSAVRTQAEIDAISGGFVTVSPAIDRPQWQRTLTDTIAGLRAPAITVPYRFGQGDS